jgi:hypothetical protein
MRLWDWDLFGFFFFFFCHREWAGAQ